LLVQCVTFHFRKISVSSLADFSFSPQSSITCSFSDDCR
jgi:hypothetical protein